MPHECTECGRSFDDGSKEMLSGCPDCGGTTFQFRPPGESSESTEPTDPPEPPEPAVDGVTRTVGTAASAVRNFVTGGGDPRAGAGPPDERTTDRSGGTTAEESATRTATADTPGPSTADDTGETASSDDPATDTESAVGDETEIITAESDPSVPTDMSGGPTGTDDGSGVDGDGSGVDGDGSGVDDESGVDGDDPGVDDSHGGTVVSNSTDDAAVARDSSSRPPVPDPRPLSVRSDTDDTRDEPESEASDQGVEVDIDAATSETAAEGTTADGVAGDTDNGEDTPKPEVPGHEDGDRPTLAQLREELNDQFESIRVVEPGQYELNLMELYDREEYIVALQEDGRYTIQLPERWEDG